MTPTVRCVTVGAGAADDGTDSDQSARSVLAIRSDSSDVEMDAGDNSGCSDAECGFCYYASWSSSDDGSEPREAAGPAHNAIVIDDA